ncbi:AhpC/TSA antioxidant enzyme [Nitzschia inconspicua]|uniref:AhpC/TSA antioxidant enzyme n=1 Tax=Nitzschia inconspicua TaxID=303405 RepID=A0A9K3LLR0_9STRA|nr:AhpC/TSA antioxidant enzyme [Nitzschia inconspicua]
MPRSGFLWWLSTSAFFWGACNALSSIASVSTPSASVTGKLEIQPLSGGPKVSLKDYISEDRTLFIFGTYAADFNALEYAQRLRYYLPILERECGITKFGFLLNCEPDAATALADLVDLDTTKVDIFVDNEGMVGKEWGVGRGWLPDDKNVNPFLKLFGMLWGLGAWATLPAVIGGYIGNPFKPQRWIEDALAVGGRKGRWPDNALELDENGQIVVNKFSKLQLVGSWPRRPLELATLRLQSMIGVSLKEWEKLAPNQKALDAGVLTQLGGCLVVDGSTNTTLFEWRDPGICAVANFEDMISKLKD